MFQPIILDSLSFTILDCGCRQLNCYFKNRPGINDFFYINFYHNGNLLDKYLYKENVSAGQDIVLNIFHFPFQINDIVAVEVGTIDEAAYEFYISSSF